MTSVKNYGTSWGFSISLGLDPVTKKQIQSRKRGYKTKREAELAANEILKLHSKGVTVKNDKVTFSEIANDWLKYYQKSKTVKHNTIAARKKAMNVLIKHLGNKKVQTISRDMYERVLFTLADNYAKNYLKSIHATASLIFKFARRNNLIHDLPTNDITFPKNCKTPEMKVEKFIPLDELITFLNSCKSNGLDSDYEIFSTFATTGLRSAELQALRWSDIDFERKTIRVENNLLNPTNSRILFKLDTPKTESSKRGIYMSDELVSILIAHKKKQELFKANNAAYEDHDFVFAKSDGIPYNSTLLRQRLHRIRKKENLSYFTLHSFRHTYCSMLATAKENQKVVAEQLGHSDIHTTLSYYVHTTPEMISHFGNTLNSISKNILNS